MDIDSNTTTTNKLYVYEDDQIYIKRMVDCPFSEINRAWHEGFNDEYFQRFGYNYRFNYDALIQRFAIETHSLEVSVVAYCKNTHRPIGMIANGVRHLNSGYIVSWNGGTAVIPEYRRKGVARKLMNAQESLLKEAKVDISSIEVVASNFDAANLYKQLGFQGDSNFLYMNQSELIPLDAFSSAIASGPLKLRVRQSSPQEIGLIPFYPGYIPWQLQWESQVLGGGGIIVENQETNEIVGYALSKNIYDNKGNVKIYSVRQIQPNPSLNQEETDQVLNVILDNLLKPGQTCTRNLYLAPNLPANEKIVSIVSKFGFTNFLDVLVLKKHLTDKEIK